MKVFCSVWTWQVILFRLDLARFYRDVDLHEEAVDVLRGILQMDIKDKDDPATLKRQESCSKGCNISHSGSGRLLESASLP